LLQGHGHDAAAERELAGRAEQQKSRRSTRAESRMAGEDRGCPKRIGEEK